MLPPPPIRLALFLLIVATLEAGTMAVTLALINPTPSGRSLRCRLLGDEAHADGLGCPRYVATSSERQQPMEHENETISITMSNKQWALVLLRLRGEAMDAAAWDAAAWAELNLTRQYVAAREAQEIAPNGH